MKLQPRQTQQNKWMKKSTLLLVGVIIAVVLTATIIIFSTTAKPGKPDDFIQVKRDLEKGFLTNLCDIGSEYYTQPEFYPSYLKSKEKAHDYTRWGVHGFGAYPGETGLTVNSMKSGQTITVCTFIHTGFNIETFQGMKPIVVGSDKFNTYVEPKTILLYPTFPDIMQKYTYKLKVIIEAKEDIPPGEYVLKMAASAPDAEMNDLYYKEMKRATQDFYKCPWLSECDENIVELRKKVYIPAGQFGVSDLYTIKITAT